MDAMRLTIPDPALVLLIGPSGAGKSTFALRHFAPTEILSSDGLRAMVSDDPNDQAASPEAFHALAVLLNARLKRRRLTVVDATNLRSANRRRWLGIARRYGIPAVAIAFDFPVQRYAAQNRLRRGRRVEEEVVRDQAERMPAAVAALPGEGYAAVQVLRDLPGQGDVIVERVRAARG